MRSTREYDAFGPWIYEVHDPADLPHLYQDAGIVPEECRLVLKVPREIERRNATPDMHLYDYLIAAGDEALTVLTRHGDEYGTTTVPYEHIVAIEDSVDLLDGRLTLHAVTGAPISIRYNGATNTPVEDLVRLLRQLYLPPRPETPPPDVALVPDVGEVDLGRRDIALVTAYRRLLETEPHLRLAGAATRRAVTPTEGWLSRAVHWVWPVTLHASIVVVDDRELQLVHRREWFTRGRGDVYSLARTVLPRTRIGAVRVHPHGRYEGVRVFTVDAGTAHLEFPVPAGSDVDAALNRLAE